MPADFDKRAAAEPGAGPAGGNRPVDEHANLVTHGLGFFLSVAASAFLMTRAVEGHEPVNIAACGIYCGSLTGLYAASTLSHSFHDLAWRRFFRTLDQACIFLLIAGSFTPVGVVYFTKGWWPLLPAAMWVLALCGVVVVLWQRHLTPAAQMTYGILGWLPVISLPLLIARAPIEILLWMIAGGLFYTLGAVFLCFDRSIRYFHAMWHTFVMAGSACHYFAILAMVDRL